jgi:hypothetical protein
MPPRFARINDLIATADAQLGLVTAAQLAEIGVPTSTTSRRRAGGMWTRVLPGVHLVDGGRPTRQQRLLAALLYAGTGSMLTGTASCRIYGFRSLRLQEVADDEPERPEPVHVLITHERRRLSTGFVRIERTHRLPAEPVRRHQLTMAPLPRAVGDAARRLPRASDAIALVTEAVQRGWADAGELADELREGPTRGSAYLRQAVAAVRLGAHSAPEAGLARLLEADGVPHVIYNATLVTGSGEFIAIADAWLDDVGVALEVDSVEHHAVGAGFERTIRRNSRYARSGVTVVTLLPTDIWNSPNRVMREVGMARTTALARPRPDVHVSHLSAPASGHRAWPWGA